MYPCHVTWIVAVLTWGLYRNWVLSGNMDLWVTEYVESRCLDSADCNVNVVQRTSSMQFHSVLIYYSCESSTYFSKETCFFGLCNVNDVQCQCSMQFQAISGTVAKYFGDNMLTAIISFVQWTMKHINFVTAGYNLGYSQYGLAKPAWLWESIPEVRSGKGTERYRAVQARFWHGDF